MSTTLDDLRTIVTGFLAQENPGRDMSSVTDRTNLVEAGLLNSAGFLDLLMLLEQAVGVEIDFAEIDPENLMSIEDICGYVAQLAARG